MKRPYLSELWKDLNKVNIGPPIAEFFVNKYENVELTTRRSIMIACNNSERQEVRKFITDHFDVLEEYFYSNEAEFTNNENPADLEDWLKVEEVNFRGRVIKYGLIQECLTKKHPKDGLENLLLKSFWRIFIRKKMNEYYFDSDITPSYFRAGRLMFPEEDFASSLKNFLRSLLQENGEVQYDKDYDYLAIFVNDADRGSGNQFPAIEFLDDGSNQIKLTDLKARVDQEGFENVFETIKERISNFFKDSLLRESEPEGRGNRRPS
ncbi:MAG: hypothetical protein HYW48_03345 [Deltaproteobacteria bacterium]|nr:hypothetical protein [Deltaproteobacteria bacterium]